MQPVVTVPPDRYPSGATMVPMPRDDTVVFSVRMPRELHDRLVEVSREDDSSVNRTLIVAARRYIRAWDGRHARRQDATDPR